MNVVWMIYVLIMAAMVYVVARNTVTMWRSNDRESAVVYGLASGFVILILIGGPFVR